MAEVLLRIYPKHEEHKVTDNGNLMLYIKLKKLLYGTLKVEIIFWEIVTGSLK